MHVEKGKIVLDKTDDIMKIEYAMMELTEPLRRLPEKEKNKSIERINRLEVELRKKILDLISNLGRENNVIESIVAVNSALTSVKTILIHSILDSMGLSDEEITSAIELLAIEGEYKAKRVDLYNEKEEIDEIDSLKKAMEKIYRREEA